MDSKLIRLVALDLDGTLTEHRSSLVNPNRRILDLLRSKYNLVMVGAGGCERIRRQMGEYPVDILGNYGMELMKCDLDFNTAKIVNQVCIEPDKASVNSRILQFRDHTGYDDYWGQPVEFHSSGMVTFPLLGTDAPLDEKLAFDRNRDKRRAHYDYAIDLFSDFTVFIGGSSSYDLVPRPYNKYYALENYCTAYGFKQSEIVYFGDDWTPGGGDWHVKNSDIHFVEVPDYSSFAFKSDFLL